jgi:hypothetical protein
VALGREEAEISTLRQLLRAPALHFVFLGAAAYAVAAELPVSVPPGAAKDLRIHVTATDIARLKTRYTGDTGIRPDTVATAALIDREVNEEILYREALALGLDRSDRAIAWRMIEKMEFLGEVEDESDEVAYSRALALGLDRDDPVVRRILIQKISMLIRFAGEYEPPDDDTMRAYLADNPEPYTEPSRIDLVHVYFDRSKRGNALESDAMRTLDVLRESGAPDPDARLPGDAFLSGHRFKNTSRHSLAKLFGDRFAEAALNTKENRWSDPIASPGGIHLVWVTDKSSAHVSDLASVKDRVTRAILAQRRDTRLEHFLKERRRDYDIEIDRKGEPSAAG